MFESLNRARRLLSAVFKSVTRIEQNFTSLREAVGRIESRQCAAAPHDQSGAQEFQVYSQWGEDGIIEWLLRNVRVERQVFVEFGVQNYEESNTRFLLVNRNWSGLILDGSAEHMAYVRRDPIYWRHNLKAVNAFITRENINDLLHDAGINGEIGLLSVDIDGVDYWVWEAITAVFPAIVVAEYNSLFGADRAVTVPYDATFQRSTAHHSNLYYGASLSALVGLGRRKGYAFVASNRAGNNAFFVRRDLLPAGIRELTVREGFVMRQFREGRNEAGELQFQSSGEESRIAQSQPLVEVES